MVSSGEEGMLVMGSTDERRVVVLLTSSALLTVSGPRQGPAAALYAHSGRVPPAMGAGQSWVRPPNLRPSRDRLKVLADWVGSELGLTEPPQVLEPNWLPAGSFRPEAYLSPGDLVQASVGGGPVMLRFDPEGGSLEWQASRQRAFDTAVGAASRRHGATSVVGRLEASGSAGYTLVLLPPAGSGPESVIRSPLAYGPLGRRLRIVELRVSRSAAGPATPGADSVLKAILPRGVEPLPAWALIDGGGRIRATSYAVSESGLVTHGTVATPTSAAYLLRQLRRAVSLPDTEAEQIQRSLIADSSADRS